MNSSTSNSSPDKKNVKEIRVKVSEDTETVNDFINEDIIKKHMNSRGKSYPQAKLYSQNGMVLRDDDILYLKTGDTVYLARHGEAFNYQQVMDRYERLSKLGSGGFGKVYLMREKDKPEQLYAVKVINMSGYMQKADGIYEIDREAKTLRMLNSRYIIHLQNYFINAQKEIILVMEYAQGGELKQYLNDKQENRISEYECQTIMKQIVTGLSSCHQKGIIHRDLKPENVLFMDKERTHIKIVDFGIAGFCMNHLKEKTDAGTFKYMAPEVLKGEINLANPSMDIWALGVMMFLMLFGYHPFMNAKERSSKEYDVKTLISRIVKSDPVIIPQPTLLTQNDEEDLPQWLKKDTKPTIPTITEECRDLLTKLLFKNPKERIQLINVQVHSWFDLSQDQIIEQQMLIQQKMNQQQQDQQSFRQSQKFTRQSKEFLKHKSLAIPSGSRHQNRINQQKQPQILSPNIMARKLSNLSPLEIQPKIKAKDEELKLQKKSLNGGGGSGTGSGNGNGGKRAKAPKISQFEFEDPGSPGEKRVFSPACLKRNLPSLINIITCDKK